MLAEICHPTLTSIAQPLREMTEQAMILLNESIDNPDSPKRKIMLMPELIVRHSTECGTALGRHKLYKRSKNADSYLKTCTSLSGEEQVFSLFFSGT